MKNPLGISPSSGYQGTTRGKKKNSYDLGGNRMHDLRIRSTVGLLTKLRGLSEPVAVVRSAAQAVCNQSLANPVEEVKIFYEPQEDGKFDNGISGDDTWTKRGYSSLYGVVTALSTITGKAVDAEVMSKNCKECTGWRGKEGTQEFQD